MTSTPPTPTPATPTPATRTPATPGPATSTPATSPIDVDAYLAALPADRRDAFIAVRERIHSAIAGLGETISYKMPAVTRQGDVVLFFAAWKHHIGLYPIPRFDGALEARVAPFRAATDTVRFFYRRPIPDGLIEAITHAIVALHHDRVEGEPEAIG